MAKIRVYEFARDLNMTNRELLDRIRDLDIDVSSHMSSLDEGQNVAFWRRKRRSARGKACAANRDPAA
jgi:translation initiation factor IF-2-like protein